MLEMAVANRIEQYLDFMLYILRADGVIDRNEKLHMMNMMTEGLKLESELLNKYKVELEKVIWEPVSDEQLSAVVQGLEPSSLGHLLRDAYALAASDGEIHDTEVAVIRRTLALAGVPAERFPQIDSWARQSMALAHDGTLLLSVD